VTCKRAALCVELTGRIIPERGFTRCGPGGPPEVTDAELDPESQACGVKVA
jgi:hypothetical protein